NASARGPQSLLADDLERLGRRAAGRSGDAAPVRVVDAGAGHVVRGARTDVPAGTQLETAAARAGHPASTVARDRAHRGPRAESLTDRVRVPTGARDADGVARAAQRDL